MIHNWKTFSEQNSTILALAPMDGYCDSAFRSVVKKVAPETVVFSEFYSANGLKHNPKLAERVLPHYENEHPLIFQIFGNEVDIFLEAGKIIQSYGADGIDINMGCPAKKVVTCGYGSGLMLDQDRAFKIVNTLAEGLDIPISVKTRLGWDGWENLIEFGQGLENAGATLLSVHGRTYKQAFKGEADWTGIYELAKNVNIPVLGNGDIIDYDDGVNKQQNLAGFMIGRACMGNPWSFLPKGKRPDMREMTDIMREHAQKLIERKGEQRACLEIRKHLASYVHGFEGVREVRKRLTQVNNLEEIETILQEILHIEEEA